MVDAKITKVYYSLQGYWKGIADVKKLARAPKVSEDAAKQWLVKQALSSDKIPFLLAQRGAPQQLFFFATRQTFTRAQSFCQCEQPLQRSRTLDLERVFTNI